MRLHGPQETGFISVTDVSRAKFPVLNMHGTSKRSDEAPMTCNVAGRKGVEEQEPIRILRESCD